MKFNPLSPLAHLGAALSAAWAWLLARLGVQSPAFFVCEVAALVSVLALAGSVHGYAGRVRAETAVSLQRQAAASEARARAAEAALAEAVSGQQAAVVAARQEGAWAMCLFFAARAQVPVDEALPVCEAMVNGAPTETER